MHHDTNGDAAAAGDVTAGLTQNPMAVLRQRFLERCTERTERMQQLKSIVGQLAAPAVDEPYREFVKIAHEISGGGGTFGCPLLSQIAAELETYLSCCRDGNLTFSQEAADRHLVKLAAHIRHYRAGRET